MRIWVDVYNPTYTTKQGSGPIVPLSAGFMRKLDEAGNGTATFAIDPRALTVLRPRHVIEIWLSELRQDAQVVRMLGAFIIDTIRPNDKERTITVKGPGVMLKLIDKITLPGLAFEAEQVGDVFDDLAALAGWTVSSSGLTDLISVRFAGENVLKGLAVVAESQGIHFRMGSSSQTIEAGAFGTNPSNHEIHYIEGDAAEIPFRTDTPMVLTAAEVIEESAEVVNWILPMGGGEGDAALTLEESDRSFVESISLNGRTHYIVSDAASIAEFGQIERRINFKRLAPTDSTDAAVLSASNALADATYEWLQRHKDTYEQLRIRIANVTDEIKPGQKIRVVYQGVLNRGGIPYKWRDINADYWVLSVEESVSSQGVEVKLDIANIDRYKTDGASIVVGMMDAVNVEQVSAIPYPATYSWGPFQQPIDTDTDVDFQFPVFDNTVKLNSVKMYVIRSVWTAVAGTAAAGGNHNHRIATYVGSTSGVTLQSIYNMRNADGGSVAAVVLYNTSFPELWTESSSGTHGHDTEFSEVQQDTDKPSDLDITVNSQSVVTGLFPDDGGDEYINADIAVVDITDAVKSVADVRTWHNVNISCGTDRGDIAVVFLIDVDISKVRTS